MDQDGPRILRVNASGSRGLRKHVCELRPPDILAVSGYRHDRATVPLGQHRAKPDAAGARGQTALGSNSPTLEQLTAAVISAEFHAIESTEEIRDILDHRRGLREAELAALRDRANPKDVLFVPTVAG
jgi:hypothetical protein